MLLIFESNHKIAVAQHPGDGLEPLVAVLRLFNFAKNSDAPLAVHNGGITRALLESKLDPSDPSWTVRVNGLASRTGSTGGNKALGKRRAEKVKARMEGLGVASSRFRGSVGSGGESYWDKKGVADSTEDGEHRAVEVAFYRVDYLTLTAAQRQTLVDRAGL